MHEKYKDLLDRFFLLDHWEGISISKVVRKNRLDEEFHKRV
jgi:hypothetical protein